MAISFVTRHLVDVMVRMLALKKAIQKLPVVPVNHGIKLKAVLDCEDEAGPHQAGEEWQLNGPRTYIPRPEVVSYLLKIEFGSEIFKK
jgi:hypothetical protein